MNKSIMIMLVWGFVDTLLLYALLVVKNWIVHILVEIMMRGYYFDAH